MAAQIYLIQYNLAYILYMYIQVDIEFKDFLAQEHNQKIFMSYFYVISVNASNLGNSESSQLDFVNDSSCHNTASKFY